jgi:hypothetical protein
MKPSIKYISLLFIGGLMLFFYLNKTFNPGEIDTLCSHSAKSQSIKQCGNEEHCFSFFKDVIVNILPELRILNQQSSIK